MPALLSNIIIEKLVEAANAIPNNQSNFDDYTIYLDMDGVLCDFDAQMEKYSLKVVGEPLNSALLTQKYGYKTLNTIIDSVGVKFFETLPKKADMEDLKVYLFSNFVNINILSALGGNPPYDVRKSGKKKWLLSHDFNLPVQNIILVDKAITKQKYAALNGILIDDYEKNIAQWREAGGIGILHKNARETIKQLRRYATAK